MKQKQKDLYLPHPQSLAPVQLPTNCTAHCTPWPSSAFPLRLATPYIFLTSYTCKQLAMSTALFKVIRKLFAERAPWPVCEKLAMKSQQYKILFHHHTK